MEKARDIRGHASIVVKSAIRRWSANIHPKERARLEGMVEEDINMVAADHMADNMVRGADIKGLMAEDTVVDTEMATLERKGCRRADMVNSITAGGIVKAKGNGLDKVRASRGFIRWQVEVAANGNKGILMEKRYGDPRWFRGSVGSDGTECTSSGIGAAIDAGWAVQHGSKPEWSHDQQMAAKEPILGL